jgi:hypothetical protein
MRFYPANTSHLRRQKLGDEALTKESEVDTTVSESNIIPEGTERNAKPAAGELAEPEDEDEEKADKKEVEADADADAGAEEQEDEEDDVEEEEEGRRPRRRAAQKAEGYYGVSTSHTASSSPHPLDLFLLTLVTQFTDRRCQGRSRT